MTKTFVNDSSRIRKYNIISKDDDEYFVETLEWKQYKLQRKTLRLIEKGNLPPHVMDLTFGNIVRMEERVEKLKKYINEFETKYKSIHLYFWSRANGTQKTTMASLLAKELALIGNSVEFILMSDLSKLLTKEGFEDGANDEISRYLNVDFLIIDDAFDSKKITVYKSGYQVPFIDTFLRKRLETKRKATCFTANVSLSDIDENVFGISLKKLMERSILDPWEFTTSYSVRNDFDPQDLWS